MKRASPQVGWSTQTADLVSGNWSPSSQRWHEIPPGTSSSRWDWVSAGPVPAGRESLRTLITPGVCLALRAMTACTCPPPPTTDCSAAWSAARTWRTRWTLMSIWCPSTASSAAPARRTPRCCTPPWVPSRVREAEEWMVVLWWDLISRQICHDASGEIRNRFHRDWLLPADCPQGGIVSLEWLQVMRESFHPLLAEEQRSCFFSKTEGEIQELEEAAT